MRIELEHTRADWHAYLRFVTERATWQRRSFWLTVLIAAGIITLLLAVPSRTGWRLELWSALVGVALVFAILLLMARFNRANAGIPESWLGPKVFELREDGLHATTRNGSDTFLWRAIRELHVTPSHLFLRLDNVVAIVLPVRALEPHGGVEAVRAEIDRLMRADAAAITSGASPTSGVVAADGPPASAHDGAPPSADGQSPDSSAGATPSSGVSSAAGAGGTKHPAWLSLPRNLLAGARLSLFVPVRIEHFSISSRQAVLLAVLTVAAWALIDRLSIEGPAEIVWYAVGQVLGLAALATALLILLGPRSADPKAGTGFMTAMAAASPFLLLIGLLLALPDSNALWCRGLMLVLPVLTTVVLYRAQRLAAHELAPLALLKAIVIVTGLWWTFDSTLYAQPRFWYSPADSQADTAAWTDSERELFGQPDLIDRAVAALKPGEAGVTEAYFVGFAGFGEQQVFGKEARFAHSALAQRLDLNGRSLQLINSPDADATAEPLATVSGLRRALAGVASRMNVDEDVLILFLTSHGSEIGELSVNQGSLPLEQLRPSVLRAALDEAGIRWRIIVISACHAGTFIPALEDAQTLVATAARADRSSFGCTDDRELTYYGEALFRDALPASGGFMDAFERARKIVGEHEKAEKIKERSEPQVSLGQRMRAKVAELQFRAAS